MDFWIIVGIVFLFCALIDLPYFVMELREDKQKKQKEDRAPVRKEQPEEHRAEKMPAPDGPFTLEYHFRNRRETDLEKINADLARYELEDLELEQHSGYLATVTRTDAKTGEKTIRYWYGLDDCILRCTPAKPGEGNYYRIHTMTMDKTTWDCAERWRADNPDRAMRTMVQLSFEEVYAIIVLHHKKVQPAAVPVSKTAAPAWPQKPASPVPSREAVSIPKKFCCRPGKDTLTWRFERGTLYIEGQGRLRCGQWPELGGQWPNPERQIRHVVIGPGCTAIADYVFQNHKCLETIELPETLRTIGERAFANCSSLREITIPDSVTGIGKGAFYSCSRMEHVQLPKNLTQIHDKTFSDCYALQDVAIPDSVQYIGRYAFFHTKSINNLPSCLGAYLTRRHGGSKYRQKSGIGEYAFAAVKQIKNCVIPDRVREIPEGAFIHCDRIDSLTLPAYLLEIGEKAFYNCNGLISVVIPPRVKKIEKEAFSGCRNLASVTFPDGLAEIGEYAFQRCKSMVSMEIPAGVSSIGRGAFAETGVVNAVLPGNITYIPQKFFSKCRNLQSVVLPDELISIGSDAFEACGSLEKIRIPDKVTFIGERAFHSCVKLTSLKLPENLTELEAAAFACCPGLTEITIPSGVRCIPRSAFACCTGLTSVTIPDSVTEIEIWGFTDCTALKDLYIPSTVTRIGGCAFTGVPGIIYHGPAESWNNWGALSRNGIPTEHKPVTADELLRESKNY